MIRQRPGTFASRALPATPWLLTGAPWLLAGAIWLLAGGASDAAGAGGFALKRLLAGEKLTRPVHLAEVPDGSGRLALTEQRGLIRTFRPGGRGFEGTLLDIRSKVSSRGNEEGLLSLAFDPGFRRNRRLFVYYSAGGPRRSVISRFTLHPSRRSALPETEQVILEIEQPYSNHNGGQLAFGPDGLLYIGLGDGGAGGDPLGHGQNRGTLLGSILRIDVRGRDARSAYRIPPDNPFADGQGGSRPEIWAYGLRNPWRFSFDRATGALYAGDVGQNILEEVDLIVRGGNYGWNVMEGTFCFDPGIGCRKTGLRLPVSEYSHAQGNSITGGFVYRGRELSALRGRYVFGDFGSGTIWSMATEGPTPRRPRVLLRTALSISSFGEDAAGELYVLDLNGALFKLAAAQ